jgi:hypothetical protein
MKHFFSKYVFWINFHVLLILIKHRKYYSIEKTKKCIYDSTKIHYKNFNYKETLRYNNVNIYININLNKKLILIKTNHILGHIVS